MKKWVYFGLVLIVTYGILQSCSSYFFGNTFYSLLEQAEVLYLEEKKELELDLTQLASFEWDSVYIIKSGDSVPPMVEEMEEDLGCKTTAMDIDRIRFYFVKNGGKKVIMKDLDNGFYREHIYLRFESCEKDRGKYGNWYSKSEAKFLIKVRSEKIGDHMYTLEPNCK